MDGKRIIAVSGSLLVFTFVLFWASGSFGISKCTGGTVGQEVFWTDFTVKGNLDNKTEYERSEYTGSYLPIENFRKNHREKIRGAVARNSSTRQKGFSKTVRERGENDVLTFVTSINESMYIIRAEQASVISNRAKDCEIGLKLFNRWVI